MTMDDTQPMQTPAAALQAQRELTPDAAVLTAIQLESAKEMLTRTKKVNPTDSNIIAVADLVAKNAATLAGNGR